jgi:hypothetical protein
VNEQLWYAGLPVVATRSLAAEELDELDAIIARGWRLSVLLAAITLVLLAFVFATMANLASALVFFVINGIAPRLLPPFVPMWRLRPLRRDRDAGIAYVCTSAGDDELPAASIDVLPQSRLIWRQEGRLPAKLPRARVTSTAPIPQHAAAAAQFVRPLQGNEQVLVHQRPLSPAELRELDAYAPAVALVRVVLAAVALVAAVASFALALEGRLTTLLAPFAFTMLAIVTTASTLRAWRLRRRIARDVEQSYVLIIRIRDGETLSVPHEFLPFSRILWTSGGEPANWRKVVSGA